VSKKKKIVVLGAGMIGSAMARDLSGGDGLEIHIADARSEVLDKVASQGPIRTHRADLADPEAIAALASGFDLVIGALPSVLGLQSVRAAIAAGCSMVDISFMGEDARSLDPMAREKGVVVVTDCGVAPGLTNMVAAHAASHFDVYERLEMAVGGLPAERTWPFQYKAGFAPWDVVEEYTRPARVVENSRVVIKEALSGLKLIHVPGVGTVESFLTDGLRSLVDTLKVPFMEERTLRWPGHTELMRIFRETGFFSLERIEVAGRPIRPRDLTAALLFPKWTFEEGEADITVMQVAASGTRDGAPRSLTFDFVDRYDPKTGLRSMSRSTGFTATAVAQLILDGVISDPGVHVPETLGARPGILDFVTGYLGTRGVHCRMSLTPCRGGGLVRRGERTSRTIIIDRAFTPPRVVGSRVSPRGSSARSGRSSEPQWSPPRTPDLFRGGHGIPGRRRHRVFQRHRVRRLPAAHELDQSERRTPPWVAGFDPRRGGQREP